MSEAPKPERFIDKLHKPVTRRDVLLGALYGTSALLFTKSFQGLVETLKESQGASAEQVNDLFNAEFDKYYARFVTDHHADFWDGNVGFDLRRSVLMAKVADFQPLKITTSVYEAPQDSKVNQDSYQAVAEIVISIPPGKEFDYKRDFEQPLFAQLKAKLPEV